jgi:major membrane immunogen (membrane-anchored lipoprotein)
MKKSLLIFLVLLLPLTLVVAEGQKETAPAGAWKDGVYFAQEDGFAGSGWKYMVTLEVKGGKIVFVDWNGANKAGGPDKKTVSKAGNYPMVARGGAQSDWHVQAELTEKHLLSTQDPSAITYTTEEGNTDDIAGVSIHVVEFYDLVKKALAAGPTGYGKYKDGAFRAEEPAFGNSGWKYTADFTVVSGYIVAANWNGVHKDGGDDKKTVSLNGGYPMVANGGAQSEWHVQAELTEKHLIETQSLDVAYTSDAGNTDDIAGVTIHVAEFYNLAKSALKMR